MVSFGGMDLPEMGALAYPEFTLLTSNVDTNVAEPVVEEETVTA